MSQHDLNIANQGFPAFRADLNAALVALGTTQSGNTAPSTTFAHQLWYDTTNSILKKRNADNDAWINIATFNESTDTLASVAGLVIGTNVQAYDADTAFTDVVQAFSKAQRGTPVGLTDGATITPDFSLGNNYSVTLGGNRTLANPTNLVAGQSGVIVITQDGTGSRTLAYGSYFKFPAGTAPTLTTAANSVDVLAYYVESSTRITARLVGDVK
jgi:hypothetical protein